MIVVKNRELIIPNTEYYIGNNSDHFTTERVFRLDRVTPDGIDLGNLTFALDMVFYNGDDNSIQLDRAVTDEAIFLTLSVVSDMLQVPGPVKVQLRAHDAADGSVRWSSAHGDFFVEDAINVPASYTGDLSSLEYWEARHTAWQTAENARKAAEDARVAAENARVIAENGRVAAEAERERMKEAFEDDRAELLGMVADAESAAHTAIAYAEGIVHAVAPTFYLDFTDGHLYETQEGVGVTFTLDADRHLQVEYTTS